MTDKILKIDIEKGLELINAKKNKEVVKNLFLEYLNQPELLKKIDPKQYKKYESNLKSLKGKKSRDFKGGGNTNKISEAFNIWKKCNFLDEQIIQEKRGGKGGSTYDYPVKKYRLNMEPFFEYMKINLQRDKQLTEKEKTFITFIFLFKESREIVCEYENLLQGILIFIERSFLRASYEGEPLIESFLKLFFIQNEYSEKYDKLKENFNKLNGTFSDFAYILLDKLKTKVVDYERLHKNPEIKYAIDSIPPIDIFDEAYIDSHFEAKKTKNSS